MVGNCFAERNAPWILECLRRGERPSHAFTQRIAVIIPDDFRAGIPGSEVVLIDAAGHVPQQERPDEVANVISMFLAAESEPAVGPTVH